jgi:Secretion system C-terminal sorting domain
MKFGLTGFLIFVCVFLSVGQTTLQSTGSGDWLSPSSWDLNRVPADKDIIVIKSGHSMDINKDINLKNITLRIIGTVKMNNGKSIILNTSSVINVISGGRIRAENASVHSAIMMGGAAKFRGNKIFNNAWGPGVINGLAYATSTTGNIDQAGIGFYLGNLPAVWQEFNLFRTSDGQVQMVWVTSHETGTRIFNVEKSSNAQTWDVIGQIESTGNMSSQNIYNFVDSDPGIGIIYYRVREIDPDGVFKLSSVRSVRFDESLLVQKVFPNPATNHVQVVYDKTKDTRTTLMMYNVNGQLIKSMALPQSSTFQKLDISSMLRGVYIIQVRYSDGRVLSNTLIKN